MAFRYMKAIDDAIEASAQDITSAPLRRIHPIENHTVKYDWPPKDKSRNNILWFNDVDVLEINSLKIDGTLIDPNDYILHPYNVDKPYRWVELKDSSGKVFTSSADRQHAIEINATTGYDNTMVKDGIISSVLDADDNLVKMTSCDVGVGSLLKINSEWVNVIDRFWSQTMDILTEDADSQSNVITLTIASLGAYMPGEVIRIGQEIMRVESYSEYSGDLMVQRAVHGSPLSNLKKGSVIERQDLYKLERAVLGSNLTSHAIQTDVYRWKVPPLINQLAIAETLLTLHKSVTNYRIKLSEASSWPIEDLRLKVWAKFKRPVVYRAV